MKNKNKKINSKQILIIQIIKIIVYQINLHLKTNKFKTENTVFEENEEKKKIKMKNQKKELKKNKEEIEEKIKLNEKENNIEQDLKIKN